MLATTPSPSPSAAAPFQAGRAPGPSYWPADLLQAFTLQMAAHGFSVSSAMMLCDRRYAIDQLAQAHAMSDERLRELALSLFRHFEAQQSGIRPTH
jgi:hypothetical protein